MIINQIKTAILLSTLTALLLFIGSFWGAGGLAIALFFVLIMNFGSYWFSDKIVLSMYGAKEANKNSKLHKLVHEVALQAKIPMPKVYMIPSDSANAFATGRDPKHAAIACNKGILDLLTDNELKGVIAHEIAHIKNRDTLISTIAATIAGVISYIATMAQWAAIFGGFGRSDDDGPNMIQLLVLIIVAPLAATIIQLAISRSREFIADESAAKTLNDSKGLSSALGKLEASAKANPMRVGNASTASLFIVNPFRGSAILNLFSTHPDIAKRIKKLNDLKL